MNPLWNKVTSVMPPDRQFVLLRGDSGMTTTPEFFTLGRTDMEYRPPINGEIRWLDVCNDSLSDSGWAPTHWRVWAPERD